MGADQAEYQQRTHQDQDTNMQFYPHKISTQLVASAVSASVATTGSFINNFAAIPVNRVNTASVALNITGSVGINGTGVVATGPQGPTGDRGDSGYRGDSIFLLSSAWSGSACGSGGTPVTCYGPVTLYNIGPAISECRFDQGGGIYYSSYADLGNVTNTDADGSFIYTDTCTTPATGISVHNGSGRIFYTDGVGAISSTACVAPGCSGTCSNGGGCADGCFCSSTDETMGFCQASPPS